MPEMGLDIGQGLGTYEDWRRECLYWYDQGGNGFPLQKSGLNVWLLNYKQWE